MPFKDEIPKVWKELGIWLHQGFFICFPNLGDGLVAFGAAISELQRKELRGKFETL